MEDVGTLFARLGWQMRAVLSGITVVLKVPCMTASNIASVDEVSRECWGDRDFFQVKQYG